jgi:glucose/arabinose dehydrogenase/chitodextrinase
MQARSIRNALTVLLCGILLGITTVRTSAETFSDPNFTSEVVATLSPFTLVGMAWAPDGRLFVWQKNGVVRVIKQGVLLPVPFIDVSDRVNTFDDRGFWGLTFHPDFANNGYVYLSYTYEEGGDPNDSSAKTSRLTRVTASSANPDVAITGSEVVILGSIGTPPCSAHPVGADCLPADSGSHSIGTLRFAPDGTLLVGNGDGADASFVDPNSMRAQDFDSWAGKILRIRDDGTAPTDNPFYDGTNSIRSKVWLYGVRNPFRFNLHPLSNEPYFGDVGWHTWEEVNRGMRGRNYGWPCFEGNLPAPGYQTTFPLCQQLTAGDVVAPLYTYDHSVGQAVIAGPVYVGSTYPETYLGSLFFADYAGSFIRRMLLDVNGNSLGVVPFATSVDSPVTLELGPDALLYYLSFGTGEIRRIRYNGPSAVISATPTSGYSPLTVSFSSAGSINPGGGALTYLWEFGDGNTSTQANPNHTYITGTVASYTARLTVRNTAGITSSATVKITVGSQPPTATISAPPPGTTALPGETVTFQGSATDPDEGLLPPTALSWTVLLHHNSHVHTFVGGSGSQGSFVAQSHGPIGTFSYEIILTATDSSGLSASTSVPVSIAADTVLPTAPTGLTASAVSPTQVNLSWTAASDNVGVTGYRVERCQGNGCTNFVEVATPAGTNFNDTGRSPQTTYRYQVRAADAANNLGPYSSIASATTPALPDTTPPSAPSGLTATAASATQVNLAWTAATDNVGVTGYRVERCQGATCTNFAQIGTPTATSFNDSGLSATTTYRYQVRAVDAAGNLGPYSTVASATTPANSDTTPPSAPSGLTATAVTATQVNLAWTAATDNVGVTGYRVERCQGASCTNFAQIATPTVTSYNDTGRTGTTTYRYRVRAVDAAGNLGGYSNIAAATTPDGTPPSAPSGLTANAANATQINLAWTAATDNVGVAGYRVERCQGAGCTNFAQIAAPTGTSLSDTGRTDATTYRYRVRAIDAAGNLGAYSSIAAATTPDGTPPSAPNGLTATPVSATRINLAWTAATDNVAVTGYRVERCQGASCTNFTQISTPTATSYADTGRTSATTYRYRVRAIDAASNLGAYSSIVSATTLDGTPPSAPSGLTATAVSAVQVNLAWNAATDNIGVAAYRVERCQGASCTNFAQIATPTATSYNDTGRTGATTYRYRVRAVDAAGNVGAFSNIASATTPASSDTTPPSAPTGLTASAVSAAQINLAWTAATDNVGVTGYRVERCLGASCINFTQIATPTGTSFNDTGVAAATTYGYQVRAVDAAGNLGPYSSIASATTPSPPPPVGGLVAAYAFNEGSGTTVNDASGNGNNGTITGATWTPAGRFGAALSFNGTSNLVQIPASSSLNLALAMTLEAWIFPTAAQSGWRTIVQREADAYFLNASNGNGPLLPGGGGTFGGNIGYASGAVANPVNAWTHVALTYDGSMLRLYVNGVLVVSEAQTGGIQTNTNPLSIGGNGPYGEFFQGVIDDVRVYNRALSQAEIQADMTVPVSP